MECAYVQALGSKLETLCSGPGRGRKLPAAGSHFLPFPVYSFLREAAQMGSPSPSQGGVSPKAWTGPSVSRSGSCRTQLRIYVEPLLAQWHLGTHGGSKGVQKKRLGGPSAIFCGPGEKNENSAPACTGASTSRFGRTLETMILETKSRSVN